MNPRANKHRKLRESRTRRSLRFEHLENRHLLAVDATLSLGVPAITGTVADFDVSLEFAATAGELLAYFSLDVEPSSPALSDTGTDYSAFTFIPASPLLDAWTQIGEFNDPGALSSVEFDDSLIASLPPGTYRLGTLRVDYGAAGLGAKDIFTVSIGGFDSVIGVEHPSQGFSFRPVQFDPAARTVLPVALSGAASSLEGSTYTLTIDKPTATDIDFLIDWGDGQQDSIDIADVPASGEVAHVFADGDRMATIRVDVLLPGGTIATGGTIDVTISNVVPMIGLSGNAAVDEGTPFTLVLGNVIDPGDDTVTQYRIGWGDGQQSVIAAADLPITREVTHTYVDGGAAPTVVVDLVDEDGTHLAAGSLMVMVDNVSPTVILTGAASVDEGTPYTLTIGPVIDPGDDAVTQYRIDWGDGIQQIVNTADLPPNRAVVHTFADDAPLVSITVDLLDEDGTHPAAGRLDVAVVNVPPTVTLTGSASIDEGVSYVLTIGEVVDPGDDTVTQYVIDWGDGTRQIIESADLPPTRQVPHTFSGAFTPTIVVGLVDEDGMYTASGTMSIVVENVPPTVTLSGLGSVNEGSAYTLNIGAVVDPGGDSVTRYVVDWGDGTQDAVDATDLPANRTVVHTFPDGDAIANIVVGLVDADGAHPTAGTLKVSVLDVAPVTSISGPATVDSGVPVTLTIGSVVDPGDDTVTRYLIDWGDGTQSTIESGQLPANREVVHTFAEPDTSPTIRIQLVNEDGTHEGAMLSIRVLPRLLDFGDAPSSFGTLRGDDGARHVATGPQLGAERDTENDAPLPLDGTGDDVSDTGSVDDEDGVTISNDFTLTAGQSATATVHIRGVVQDTARLFAWIDFDGSGTFEPEEQIADGSTLLTYGDHDLSFNVPERDFIGMSYARFRVASQTGLGPSGPAVDGEVEDYPVTILRAETACLTGQPLASGGIRLIYSCVTPSSLSAFVVGTRAGTYLFEQYNTTVQIADPEVVALGIGNLDGITVAHVELPSKFVGRPIIFQAFEVSPHPQLSNLLTMNASPSPLQSTDIGPGAAPITAEDVVALVDAAIARWESAGLSERELETLRSTPISAVDLPDGRVGATSNGQVFLDLDAAGKGWFVDPTPHDDAEFQVATNGNQLTALSSPADERFDALTAIMHEFGHVLGMPDLPSNIGPDHLMQHQLEPGVRRNPVSHTNWQLNEDVNADGHVSPMDALLVINVLNGVRSWSLMGRPEMLSETGNATPAFIDTDHDNFITPRDVLRVINYLNRDPASSGEGEAPGRLALHANTIQIPETVRRLDSAHGVIPVDRCDARVGKVMRPVTDFAPLMVRQPTAMRPQFTFRRWEVVALFDQLAEDDSLARNVAS